MGFLLPSSSFCHFQISGQLDVENRQQWLAGQLTEHGFKSIEQGADEHSVGWATLDDIDQSDFSNTRSWSRDQYICFTLRQDRRRIPASLYKRLVSQLSGQFLENRPGLKRVPKGELEEIRDRARTQLMARTLPTPSTTDVVWDTENNLIRFCSTGQKQVETFQGLFHQTFPGLRLTLLHPMKRASLVIDESLKPRLQEANQAQSDSAIEQIESNRWLGVEFFQWLLYRTLNSDSRYQVSQDGPLLKTQEFTAFLDDRLVLTGGGQEGEQKIVVAGPQDQYSEVRSALARGKVIEEAIVHMQLDEEQAWRMTLKGEKFFFGSFRTPMVKPERDPADDRDAEAEAAFYCKIGSVSEGEQMLHSLLGRFLAQRLSDSWKTELKTMTEWQQA